MSETTVFSITNGPDYWAECTDEEIALAVQHQRERVEEYCQEQGYDVEIRVVPETTSWNNRSYGDEAVIEDLNHHIERHWVDWLEEALEPLEALREVMTVREVADEYGVEVSTIRRTCINGWILARKSGATWLMRRSDVIARWGGKARSIALLLVSLGLTAAIWMTWFV